MGQTSTAKWRPYAGGGSGPRGSASRRSSAQSTTYIFQVRPCRPSGSKPAGPKTSIASCGPPRREASARTTLKGRKSTIFSAGFVPALFAVAASGGATSSVELQPAAWGGGELRGSKSRRSPPYSSSPESTAQSTAPCRPHQPIVRAPPPKETVPLPPKLPATNPDYPHFFTKSSHEFPIWPLI